MGTLEQDLADFLIGMQDRGTLDRSYYQACMRFWTEHYGKTVADKVRAIVKAPVKK